MCCKPAIALSLCHEAQQTLSSVASSRRYNHRVTNAHRWSLAALAAILLIALALRLPQMGESLWLDELHTAWVVNDGLREIPARAAIGNHSPLYFLLPWATTRLFGMNEVALRLPSLVAGLAVIVAIYALVWRMTASHVGALLAAWLAAIEPNFLWYSLEARPYAWVQLVGVLQAMAFWQSLAQPTWRSRMALVLLSIALFYFHYTASLLFVAEVLYLVAAKLLWPSETRYSLRQTIFDAALVIAGCAPSVMHLLAIADRREAWWKFVRPKPAAELLTIFPLLFTVAVPLIVLLICRGVRWWRKNDGAPLPLRPLTFALLWLFVPLLVAWSATQLELAPLWLRRYVMVSAAASLVFAGVSSAAIGHRRLQYATALAIALAFAWAMLLGPQRQLGIDDRIVARSKQDWRAATAVIRDDPTTADWPVLVRSGFIEADAASDDREPLLRAYLLSPVTTIYDVQNGGRKLMPLPYSLPMKLLNADVEPLAQQAGLWLITPGNPKTKDASVRGVRLALLRRGRATQVVRAEDFGGVWVVQLRMTKSQ